MKKLAIIGFTLGLFIGVAAGVPYVTGRIIEKQFHRTLASLSEHQAADFQVLNYERAWFGAKAQSVFQLQTGDGSLWVTLDHDIKHGPFPTSLDLGTITSTVALSDQTAEALQYYFKDQAPVEIVTHIGLRGDQRISVTSPSFHGLHKEKPDTALLWTGIQGEITISPALDQVQTSLRAPFLAAHSTDKAEMTLKNVGLDIDLTRHADSGIWLWSAQLKIDKFDLFDQQAADPAMRRVNFQNLTLSQDMTQADDLLALAFKVSADSLTAADQLFSNAQLEAEMRNINAHTFARLDRQVKTLAAKGLSPERIMDIFSESMQDSLPTLLSRFPELSITRFTLATATESERFDGAMRVRYIGGQNIAGFDPIIDLEGEASLAVPRTIMETLLFLKTRQDTMDYININDLDVTPTQIDQYCREETQKLIDQLTTEGLIKAVGEQYQCKVSLHGGELKINGKQV